jgi:hypothetical protein
MKADIQLPLGLSSNCMLLACGNVARELMPINHSLALPVVRPGRAYQ